MTGCHTNPRTPIGTAKAHTLELVSFRAIDSASKAAVGEAGMGITPRLRELPGFEGRVLARSAEGRWIDAVWWRSKVDATHAAQSVLNDPNIAPAFAGFFELIDQSKDFDFSHSLVILRDAARSDREPAVIEVVRFRRVDHVDHEEFTRLAENAFEDLRTFPGMIADQLSVDDSGRYIHIVAWGSYEDASSAPARAAEMAAPSAWFERIDPASIDMEYYTIVR